MTIRDLYDQARQSGVSTQYRVVEIPDSDGIYIGSDRIGKPCIFFRCADTPQTPSLITERLSLDISNGYTLSLPDGTSRSGRYNAIICLSDEADDIEAFLAVIDAFIEHNGRRAVSTSEIVAFFNALLRLFSVRPDADTNARRQGLWGELFFMRQNGGYSFWAPFWHTETTRLFDFSAGSRRVEVKTVIGSERIHQVSHRQMYSQDGEEIYIASLLLTADDSGVSLRTLIAECRAALRETPHYIKLEKSVRHARMHNGEEGPRFNADEASRSQRVFNTALSPRWNAVEPEGVSGTRYKIDLTNITPVASEVFAAWIGNWSV